MSRPLSVVLAGGGSGGHIEPAMAVADALRREDPDTVITALGTARGLEVRLIPERGYPLRLVPAVPLPRRPGGALLRVPNNVRRAIAETRAVLADVEADVVIGFGGYVALPAYLAAGRRTPLVVHEANPRPGLANRVGARRTHFVGVATEGVPLPHARVVGMPLRRSITTLDRLTLRPEARAHFGLEPDVPTLLVTGGSQGARSLNLAAAGAAADLAAHGIGVLHIYGPRNTLDVPATDGPPYVRQAYCDRMDLAYAAADLVLCRAGMTTVAELGAVGLPAAYVPLPHGNGEQRLNAAPAVAGGAALMVEDSELSPAWICSTLVPLLGDQARLAGMAQAAGESPHRHADETIVAMLHEAAGR